MKIRHYSLFDSLHSGNIDWDLLRDSATEQAYYIPFSREEYLGVIEKHNAKEHLVSGIIEFCKKFHINKIVSIGSGRCVLEYYLKKRSDFIVTVTDTSASINRIAEFGIFDAALQVNLLESQEMRFDDATLVLLGRIDTEFEDEGLKQLFSVLRQRGAGYLGFIPAELLTFRIFLAEIKILLTSIITGKKRIFCGYARTKDEFRSAWNKFYTELIQFGHNDLFFLKAK
jgi:hypothetical protein